MMEGCGVVVAEILEALVGGGEDRVVGELT